jgi:hypothetical protein
MPDALAYVLTVLGAIAVLCLLLALVDGRRR